MSVTALTYENLKVSPYAVTSIQSLEMTQAVNEHARLRFTAIVPEDQRENYVASTQVGTNICITDVGDEKEEILFNGMVLNIEVKAVRDIYYLEVEAVSYSYLLDIKRKSRSFQNEAMTIPALLERMGADYSGSDMVDEATGGAAIGQFIMQYQETDWQFLKRIASRFQAGLLPFPAFEQPKITLGVPDGDDKGKIEAFNFEVKKRLEGYHDALKNSKHALEENDFIDYEVESFQLLNLGSMVTWQGQTFYVRESRTELKDGLLRHRYILCSRNGMKPRQVHNDQLIGASIQGKVIEVTEDKVRVHLDIDERPPEGSWWFTYSTIYTAGGGSGWYCMPELGDRVIVHFPSRDEDKAVAISSVRENTGAGSPSVKYFRSASGKEVKLTPEEIIITGKDGEIFIRLHEKEGIQVISKQNIELMAKEDLTMSTEKKMIVSAKEELEITCQESNIRMDGNTDISGKETKTN